MSTYFHEINAYYGIFYPAELGEDVTKIVGANPKFKGLVDDDDDASYTGDKFSIFPSNNSDRDDPTRKFFFVDEMTVGGEDDDSAEAVFLNFEPTELVKLEERYKAAVETITDLYDYLVKEFRSRRINPNQLHLGWSAVTCTWLDDDSDEEEEEEPPKKAGKNNKKEVKKEPVKKEAPAAAKSAAAKPAAAKPEAKAKGQGKKKKEV